MSETNIPQLSDQGDELVRQIKPQLAGHDPRIQGMVLFELAAIYLAGHHPALREQMLSLHLNGIRSYIPVAEAEIFPNGKPEGWEAQ